MRTDPLLRVLLPCLLAFLATSAHAAGTVTEAAAENAPIERTVWAWVAVDAAGAITAVEADAGQNAAIAEAVTGLVKQVPFAPAALAGNPVASAVPLEIGLRFTPDAAGEYAAALTWARVHTVRMTDSPPPRYPMDEVRRGIGGYVLTSLVVAGEGQADPASLATVDQIAFEGRRVLTSADAVVPFVEATRAVLPQWRFRAAEIDGEALPVRVHVPTTFHPPLSRRPGEPTRLPESVSTRQLPQPEPQVLRDGVVLPAVTGALALAVPPATNAEVEVVSSRLRRGAGQ